jgi:hypothetical protein
MEEVKAWLKAKWGPLPAWVWLVGALFLVAVLV